MAMPTTKRCLIPMQRVTKKKKDTRAHTHDDGKKSVHRVPTFLRFFVSITTLNSPENKSVWYIRVFLLVSSLTPSSLLVFRYNHTYLNSYEGNVSWRIGRRIRVSESESENERRVLSPDQYG